MTQPVADAHDRTVRWRQLVDLLSRPHDELDPASTINGFAVTAHNEELRTSDAPDTADALATCYLQVSRLGYGAFDLLSRYEAALWRQAAQIFFMLQSTVRRPR